MVKKNSPLLSHLILRDFLAVDRTRLANERTLLSYLRTGLTLMIAGVSGYNVFQNVYMRGVSVVFTVLGIGFFIFGFVRYRKLDNALSYIHEPDYARIDHPIIKKNNAKAITGQISK